MKYLFIIFFILIFSNVSQAIEIPANAHLDYTGKTWVCNRGYQRSGNACVKVILPENAELDYTGNRWKCSRGYYKSGNKCIAVSIPPNAELDYTGSRWKCSRGFYKSGNKCVAVPLPKNAELDYTGSRWKCQRGYMKTGNRCVRFSVPDNAAIDASGNNWRCNLNFKKQGDSCVPMTKKEIEYQNLLILRARACGNSYNYDVSGYCGGEYVYGNVDACSNSKEVSGYVIFDNGAQMDFEGEWVSKGEIEGTDGFGNYCDLEVD